MAPMNAPLEPGTSAGLSYIHRTHARSIQQKRESRGTSGRKRDPSDRGEVGRSSGYPDGDGRGAWKTVKSNRPRRGLTPAQLRHERATSGSLPSLDLEEVEADANRDDLNSDLSLFNRNGTKGKCH